MYVLCVVCEFPIEKAEFWNSFYIKKLSSALF